MNSKEQGNITRVGIVGAGYVSSYHIRALQSLKNVRIVGVTDMDPQKGQQTASAFGIQFVSSTQEMYAQKPDVVHILTPPSSHCVLALEALENGCHVFVEKPMAVSEEECDRMIRHATSAAKVLSVNHSAKFDPAVQEAAEFINSGAIGSVLAVDYVRTSEYPPYRGGPMPPPYREGGYPFRDLGVHALYLMELFLGEIEGVETRHGSTGHHPHVMFDDWHLLVQCQRGAGHVHLSWSSRPIEHTLIVRGTQGVIELDLYLETCVTRRNLPIPKPVEAIVNAAFSSLSYALQIARNTLRVATGKMLRSPDIHSGVCEFHSALSSGGAPPVSAAEGKRMVAWLEKAAVKADRQKLEQKKLELRPAAVLVTGGTGFLGNALVKALVASGATVRILAHRRFAGEFAHHPLVDVITGDLGEPEVVEKAVQGVELVYHVGAATGGSWEQYESGTLWGTKNIIQSSLRHQVKVVYVSSLSVLRYAGLPNCARLDEGADLEPFADKRGHYAKSKLEAENLVIDAVRSRGLNAVIIRPGNIFGQGAERVPPYGIIALGNRWVVMGSGKTLLPLIYIDDVVDALIKAGTSEYHSAEILHVVDPDQITQKEYMSTARSSLPEIKLHHCPMAVLYCFAVAAQLLGRLTRRNVPLTTYRLRSIRPHVEFDCYATSRLLRWVPATGVHEGLKRTFGRPREATTQSLVAYPDATARP
jgi:2-alkyl-3-oxoalkanoate reductase